MSTPETPAEFKNSLKKVGYYPFVNKYLPFERLLIRPPAFLVVKALYRTPVTPNQLTFLSFFIGLGAGAAYLGGKPGWFVLGGILIILGAVFDCADGQLARLKNMTSIYGAYLDIFLDRITDFVVIVSVVVGYYRYTHRSMILAIGLLACAVYFLEVTLYYMIEMYRGFEKTGEGAEGRGVAIMIIFITSLLGRLDWLIYGLLVYSGVNVGIKFARFLRLGRAQAGVPRS